METKLIILYIISLMEQIDKDIQRRKLNTTFGRVALGAAAVGSFALLPVGFSLAALGVTGARMIGLQRKISKYREHFLDHSYPVDIGCYSAQRAQDYQAMQAHIAKQSGIEDLRVLKSYDCPSIGFSMTPNLVILHNEYVGEGGIFEDDELLAIYGHEAGHLQNGDIPSMHFIDHPCHDLLGTCIALASISALTGYSPASTAFVALCLLPALALKSVISRQQEYRADLDAVKMTGNADSVKRMLTKTAQAVLPIQRLTESFLAQTRLGALKLIKSRLTDPHPSWDKRIQAVERYNAVEPGVVEPEAVEPQTVIKDQQTSFIQQNPKFVRLP